MSIFAAALGASRGALKVSQDYMDEQAKQKALLQQLAIQDRGNAFADNNSAWFADASKALGVEAPASALTSLDAKKAAADKLAGLQVQGLETGIRAQEHGMKIADMTLEQRKSEFLKTHGLNVQQFLENQRQFNVGTEQRDRHHADDVSLQKEGLGLQRQRLAQDARQHAASLAVQSGRGQDLSMRLGRLAEAARDLTGAKSLMEDDAAYAARLATNFRNLLKQAGLNPDAFTMPAPTLPEVPAAPAPAPQPSGGFFGIQLPGWGQRPTAPPAAHAPAAAPARPAPAAAKKPAGPKPGKAFYEEHVK